MKTLLSLIFSLAIASSAFAVEMFEGRVKMRFTSDGKSNDIGYATKGAKIRMEMDTKKGAGASIMDFKANEMIVLMPEQKTYMAMSTKDSGVSEKIAEASSETTMEKTAETVTILGYKATKYLAKNKDQKEPIEIWATEGLGSFIAPGDAGPGAGKRTSAPWEREMREKGFFPLKTIMKDKRGRVSTMEVVSLEKVSLPDSLFVPPADYQKFTMPGGLGNLIPGFGGKN